MIVICLFGRMADIIGRRRLEINAGEAPATLYALRDRVFADALASRQVTREAIRMSVNQAVTRDDAVVHDGDEVAFFSVFSGG